MGAPVEAEVHMVEAVAAGTNSLVNSKANLTNERKRHK
jgi:hypothetical protein